jgi:hypothetical protein
VVVARLVDALQRVVQASRTLRPRGLVGAAVPERAAGAVLLEPVPPLTGVNLLVCPCSACNTSTVATTSAGTGPPEQVAEHRILANPRRAAAACGPVRTTLPGMGVGLALQPSPLLGLRSASRSASTCGGVVASGDGRPVRLEYSVRPSDVPICPSPSPGAGTMLVT